MESSKIITLMFLFAIVGIVAITCNEDKGDSQPQWDTEESNSNGNNNNSNDTDWQEPDTGEEDTGENDDTGDDDTGDDDTGEKDTGREPWPSTKIDDSFADRNCEGNPADMSCNGAVCNVIYDSFSYHRDDCENGYYAPAICEEFERCFKEEGAACFDKACEAGTRPGPMNMPNKMIAVVNCVEPTETCLDNAYQMDTDS